MHARSDYNSVWFDMIDAHLLVKVCITSAELFVTSNLGYATSLHSASEWNNRRDNAKQGEYLDLAKFRTQVIHWLCNLMSRTMRKEIYWTSLQESGDFYLIQFTIRGRRYIFPSYELIYSSYSASSIGPQAGVRIEAADL